MAHLEHHLRPARHQLRLRLRERRRVCGRTDAWAVGEEQGELVWRWCGGPDEGVRVPLGSGRPHELAAEGWRWKLVLELGRRWKR